MQRLQQQIKLLRSTIRKTLTEYCLQRLSRCQPSQAMTASLSRVVLERRRSPYCQNIETNCLAKDAHSCHSKTNIAVYILKTSYMQIRLELFIKLMSWWIPKKSKSDYRNPDLFNDSQFDSVWKLSLSGAVRYMPKLYVVQTLQSNRTSHVKRLQNWYIFSDLMEVLLTV